MGSIIGRVGGKQREREEGREGKMAGGVHAFTKGMSKSLSHGQYACHSVNKTYKMLQGLILREGVGWLMKL